MVSSRSIVGIGPLRFSQRRPRSSVGGKRRALESLGMGRHTYVTRTLPCFACTICMYHGSKGRKGSNSTSFASTDWHRDNVKTDRPTAFGQLAEYQWSWSWGYAYKRRSFPKAVRIAGRGRTGAWLVVAPDVGEETRSCNHLHRSEQTQEPSEFWCSSALVRSNLLSVAVAGTGGLVDQSWTQGDPGREEPASGFSSCSVLVVECTCTSSISKSGVAHMLLYSVSRSTWYVRILPFLS